MEANFNKNDYIINKCAGDIAIVKGVSKKGYYQFKEYYNGMTDDLKDLNEYNYELQVNYQKMWELCNDKEKEIINKKIKERNEAQVN